MYTNGVVYDTSFSAFMTASQNPQLGNLVLSREGNGGVLLLDPQIAETRLRYGPVELDSQDGTNATGLERMAFGLADGVAGENNDSSTLSHAENKEHGKASNVSAVRGVCSIERNI